MATLQAIRRNCLLASAALILCSATPSLLGADPQFQAQKAKLAPQFQELRTLTPQVRLQFVGKSQTLRGFYSNKSVPLIVDDINRMSVREPLPPGSYILLSGPIASTIRHGDQLELAGTIVRPTATDALQLRGEQTVLKLAGAEAIKVVRPSVLRPVAAINPAITQQLVAASSKSRLKIEALRLKFDPAWLKKPTHYAVLINGGINFANYWVSFYNDLVVDYNMLLGRGYLPANIFVLNANGGGAPPGTTPCGSIPVHYAATSANVTKVFNDLTTKILPQDTLTVMITDHGGTGLICLWGENMPGATFGALVNQIKNYSQMTFSFDLCHAAGLIPSVRGANRIIYAACDADKSAYDNKDYHFGALNFAVVSALTGLPPVGPAVNADANGDGAVSLAEGFNYIRLHMNSGGTQTPHYEDDALAPDATAQLPSGPNGVFGLGRFL